MGAYNLVNGTKCCEHKQLLDDILRDEYGFDGFVVSDWSAVRDTKASAEVGMDIELSVTPNFDDYYFANPLKKAVEDGDVKRDVDRKVERVIAVMDALHMLGDAHINHKPGVTAARPRGEGIGHRPRIHRAAEKHGAPAAARQACITSAVCWSSVPTPTASTPTAAARPSSKRFYEVSPLLGLNGELGGNVEIEYARSADAKQINQDESQQEESLENSKGSDAVKT